MVNQYKRIKRHESRQKDKRHIYWGIVLLDGTTLLTQICYNGSKNRLLTRHTTDFVGFWSPVHRYFSLSMRHISQVRRFDKPPCIGENRFVSFNWLPWSLWFWLLSANQLISCPHEQTRTSNHLCFKGMYCLHNDSMARKCCIRYCPFCWDGGGVELTSHRWIPLTMVHDTGF